MYSLVKQNIALPLPSRQVVLQRKAAEASINILLSPEYRGIKLSTWAKNKARQVLCPAENVPRHFLLPNGQSLQLF